METLLLVVKRANCGHMDFGETGEGWLFGVFVGEISRFVVLGTSWNVVDKFFSTFMKLSECMVIARACLLFL